MLNVAKIQNNGESLEIYDNKKTMGVAEKVHFFLCGWYLVRVVSGSGGVWFGWCLVRVVSF